METSMRTKRYRFSLRTLLLCVTLVAFIFMWLKSYDTEGQHHERIAARLTSLGCDVEFSHMEWVPVANPSPAMTQFGGVPFEQKSTLPKMIEDYGASRSFRRLSRVTLRSRSELGTALDVIDTIPRLDSLYFDSTGVTQSQLAETLNATHVKKLYFTGESLPRTEMPWLRHDGLEWLCVMRTQFSNTAIASLPLSLNYLDATRTRINDDGLDGFTRLTNLRTLKLKRTPTTKDAIEQLRGKMPWCDIQWQPLVIP
jgi:hypothetical protein